MKLRNTFLYCNRPSNSAKNLAASLGIRRIKRERSRFKGRPHRAVINWGCSTAPNELNECYVLNIPEFVARASNKLSFFDRMMERYGWDWGPYPFPDFTTDKAMAIELIHEGHMVVCRTVLNGHSGKGIVLARTVDELVDAPLYVKYQPKDAEWRVHVFAHLDEEYTDVQKKVKRKDYEGEHNRQIRNHQNGYNYQRQNLNIPDGLTDLAIEVIEKFDLHFGAVDIIQYRDNFYVLEVNTAPGLEGTTLDIYSEQLRRMIEGYNL